MGKVHASLFSGFGAADLAATWMGWNNAFWCEIDDFPRTVLSYWFPKSKGYGNIKETDFTPWRGKIDVLTGGFPCQPFSVAGQRKGQEDDRYLWPEMLRAIREIRPTWVIGENVGGIISMVQPGSEITVESQASLFEETDKETILEQEYVVESVCRDLEQEGYSVQPIVIPACAIGAPHRRDRVWFIANRTDAGVESMQSKWENPIYGSETTTDTDGKRRYNRSYNRQERPICNDKERDSSKNQSERAEWKCRTCENGSVIANSNSHKLQAWLKTRRRTHTAKDETRLDNGTKRFGDLWYAPYTNGNKLETKRISFCFDKGRWKIKNRRPEKYTCDTGRTLPTAPWENFPTQSPVCSRDDGLSRQLDDITFSKWREGSIKGYGNAIVPQVMYEIFKAIETIQD